MPKHLTDLERLEIEHALKQRKPIKQIACETGKSPRTVSREIRSRSVPSDKGAFGHVTNRYQRSQTFARRNTGVFTLRIDHFFTAYDKGGARSENEPRLTIRRMLWQDQRLLFCSPME